jgi:hypothetical protein
VEEQTSDIMVDKVQAVVAQYEVKKLTKHMIEQ